MNFLFEVINELSNAEVNGDALSNGKRMLSATIIIICIYKMIQSGIKIDDISSDNMTTLLSLFCLQPNVQEQKCEDWEYLVTYIPESSKNFVYEAIQKILNHLMCKKFFNQPSWLFAIPVLHFLKQVSHPFKEIEYDFKKIQWKNDYVKLATVRKKTQYAATSQ